MRNPENRTKGKIMHGLFKKIPVIILLTGFAACTKVHYHGKSFPATNNVRIYMDTEQVPKGRYMVMGKAAATVSSGSNGNRILRAIKEKAMEKGANAVVILSFGTFETGRKVEREKEYGPLFTGWDYQDYWEDYWEDDWQPPWGFGPSKQEKKIIWNPKGNVSYKYKTVIRALFLRDKEGG